MRFTGGVGTNYYYHADGLGSVTEVTDRFGLKAESYTYDVYGTPTIYNASAIPVSQSAIGNRLLFTARDRDPDTTLYNYRYRYYSPSLGRFVTPEALSVREDGWNLYLYTENSSVNWADPDGLSKIKVSGYGVWSDEIEGDAAHLHLYEANYRHRGQVSGFEGNRQLRRWWLTRATRGEFDHDREQARGYKWTFQTRSMALALTKQSECAAPNLSLPSGIFCGCDGHGIVVRCARFETSPAGGRFCGLYF